MSYNETFEVKAPAEAVFQALLDQKILESWLAENVRIEPHKGGTFRFWGRDVIWCQAENETEGEILELDAPRRLVFSWRWKGHASRVDLRGVCDRSGAGGCGLHGLRAPRIFQGDANRPSSGRPREAVEGCQTHCRPGFAVRSTDSALRMCPFR